MSRGAELDAALDELDVIIQGFERMGDEPIRERAMEDGAEWFAAHMRGLSSPRGRKRPHMLEGIKAGKSGQGVVVGWTIFYGRFVESGHATVLGKKLKGRKRSSGSQVRSRKPSGTKSFVRGTPHMKPEFEHNKDKIITTMMKTLEGAVR